AEQEIGAGSLASAPAIVLGKTGWNHGIVGIVAGRIAEKLGNPTAIIGFEGGVGRGSLRGPPGFPLFDALKECSSHLVRFGGHQAAAGLEIELQRLDGFRKSYEHACARRSNFERPAIVAPLTLLPGDEVSDVLSDLYMLEPCGE